MREGEIDEEDRWRATLTKKRGGVGLNIVLEGRK